MRIRKYFKKEARENIKKAIAVYLSLTLMFEIVAPTCAYALTGGPSQPEVQSFEPIGTSDMVDLFSGDFTYNIPLLDIDGYPINISYNGGITMDQEASWVGLGWNINPGVVNRAMRGLPDDFAGDEVKKEYNMKPNKTFGLKTGLGVEIFGLETDAIFTSQTQFNASYSLGINWNNFNGMGIEQSLSTSVSSADKCKSRLNLGLGLSSSSDNGLSVQPSLSYSKHIEGSEDIMNTDLTTSIGTSFNSRMGLQQLTFGANFSNNFFKNDKKGRLKTYQSGGSIGSASFQLGMPTYTPDMSMPMTNLSLSGTFKVSGLEFFGANGTFDMSAYLSVQNLRETERISPAYGYMNSDNGQQDKDALLDFNRYNYN